MRERGRERGGGLGLFLTLTLREREVNFSGETVGKVGGADDAERELLPVGNKREKKFRRCPECYYFPAGADPRCT